MSREKFEKIKAGDPISAKDRTRRGDVLNRLANLSGGTGVSGRHTGSTVNLGVQPPSLQGIVEITEVVDASAGTYKGKLRKYSFAETSWKNLSKDWAVDASGLDFTLAVGDKVFCFWDELRGMFVPGGGRPGVIDVIDFQATAAHPGRGVLFDVQLGTWNSATHAISYSGPVYKAIDWRCWDPVPDEPGWTGVGVWRASDTYDRVLYVIDADCEACEDFSSESSPSSGSISSQSSASSPSSPSSASSESSVDQSSASESSKSTTESFSSASSPSSESQSSASDSSKSGSFSSGSSASSPSSASESSASSVSSQSSKSSQSSASESSYSSLGTSSSQGYSSNSSISDGLSSFSDGLSSQSIIAESESSLGFSSQSFPA